MPTVRKRYAIVPTASAGSKEQAGAAAAPVVLMVSGGADSTALFLMALTEALDIQDGQGCARIARERLHVLHVNHQLRAGAADADEQFVRNLCAEFGVPLSVEKVDVASLAKQSEDDSNIENIARRVRYAAANALANKLCAEVGLSRGLARIVTAHTANDRTETFFMNAITGTGTQGLSSIPRRRNRIVRPLLDYTHEQLKAYLTAQGRTWCEDATNSDTHYLRAYVRHEIVPRATERNPHLFETISSTCDILTDEDIYLTQVSARTLRSLELRHTSEMIILDAARLAGTEVALARRIVRMAVFALDAECRLDAEHVASILKIVAAGKGSTTLPGAFDARVQMGLLTICNTAVPVGSFVPGWLDVLPLGSSRKSTTIASPGQTSYFKLAGASVTARLREVGPMASPVALAQAHGREWEKASVLLDAEACGLGELGGKLWIDSPQLGDVLCPLGMHGQSKKLSDLLIDEKVPAAMRSSVPIVRTSPKGQIVWVAPIRADERACVTPASRVLLELHFRDENFGLMSAPKLIHMHEN